MFKIFIEKMTTHYSSKGIELHNKNCVSILSILVLLHTHFVAVVVSHDQGHEIPKMIVVNLCSGGTRAIGQFHHYLNFEFLNSSQSNSPFRCLGHGRLFKGRVDLFNNPNNLEPANNVNANADDNLVTEDYSNSSLLVPRPVVDYDEDEGESYVELLSTGELLHDFDGINTYYFEHEFCVELQNGFIKEIQLCLSNCDQNWIHLHQQQAEADGGGDLSKTLSSSSSRFPPVMATDIEKESCIQKCCTPDEILKFSHSNSPDPTCHKVSTKGGRWKPPDFYSSNSLDNVCIDKMEKNISYRFQKSFYHTKYESHVSVTFDTRNETKFRKSFRLLEDGSVAIRAHLKHPLTLSPRWTKLDLTKMMGNFCVDGIQLRGSTEGHYHQMLAILHPNEANQDLTDLTSTEPKKQNDSVRQLHVNLAANVLSLVPLGFTILVYLMTWSSQNIHGWTIFSHIASLFLLHTFLVAAIGTGWTPGSRTSTSCKFVGIMAHFFFLSTFFWLTVVNVDLFFSLRSLNQIKKRQKELLTFLGYAVLCWGGPLVVVIVGISLDAKYGVEGNVDSDCEVLVPNYGQFRCMVSEEAAGAYLYFIIGFLILLNLTLVMATFRDLYLHRRRTQGIRKNTSCQTISWELFLKLFIVTGVSLTLEIITWACATQEGTFIGEAKSKSWAPVIIDFFNWTTRAILIFVIFCVKKKVFRDIQKRWTSLTTFGRKFTQSNVESSSTQQRNKTHATIAESGMNNDMSSESKVNGTEMKIFQSSLEN